MNRQGNGSAGGCCDRSDPQLARQGSAALARTVAGGRSRPDTDASIVAIDDARQTGDGWTVSVRAGGIGIDLNRTDGHHDGGIRVESESRETSTDKHTYPKGGERR